jgi:hypothetical protein
MSDDPAPSLPFQKENGNWAFFIYPQGVETEAGEYQTKETAEQWSIKALRLWQINGQSYSGNIGIID